MKRLLVEGWRGIHQSLAMANQYQLIELARMEGVVVAHRDLPYSNPQWSRPENTPGFPPGLESVLASVTSPQPGESFDAAYRIAMPFGLSEAAASRRISYIISEFALRDYQFASGQSGIEEFCHDGNLVVTPSRWSRMKLVEYGIPEDGIHIVPHGVNSEIFFPLSVAERMAARRELDYSDEEFVFLNLGSLTLEKGVDILLQAFSVVRRHHSRARLVLKDSSNLYGLTLADFVAQFSGHYGAIPEEVLASTAQVPSSLTLQEMRRLYGAADAYVSPYRAEGFNLPVIEAIACGTPAIVTLGGATDDFCDVDTALFVEATEVPNRERAFYGNERLDGYHLEPRLESLIEQMETALVANIPATRSFSNARQNMIERFSWVAAANKLVELI